jgi:hypothetical protein
MAVRKHKRPAVSGDVKVSNNQPERKSRKVNNKTNKRKHIMNNTPPGPSKTDYPHTFSKYSDCEEERNAWFASVFGLIALYERQMREDSLPCPQFTVEQLDALSLAQDEWDETISDPERVKQMFIGAFKVGLGRLKASGSSQERNNWVDTVERCYKKDYKARMVFLLSVGGNVISKIMGGTL